MQTTLYFDLLQRSPSAARGDIDQDGDFEVGEDPCHDRGKLLGLVVHNSLGDLKEELVVNLGHQPHLPLLGSGPAHPGPTHHRRLDEVCCAPLDDRVHRLPLRGLPILPLRRVDLRQVPAALQDGLNETLCPAGLLDVRDEGLDARKVFQEGALKGLGSRHWDPKLLAQRHGARAVDDRVHGPLGLVPGRPLPRGRLNIYLFAEPVPRQVGEEIAASVEDSAQLAAAAEVGKQPDLDLGVVEREQAGALLRHEGVPYVDLLPGSLPSRLQALGVLGHGLQVGIRAGQPPRRGGGLVPPAVDLQEGPAATAPLRVPP
mmetsp:Transcript_148/g.603  ORF Transcript_148/g.603 Transcript_148/m.603 type:complete len:316 (+) Transcript_148:1347-2294(+)